MYVVRNPNYLLMRFIILVPPFGADDVEGLEIQSIFEILHLQQQWHLLNTQCMVLLNFCFQFSLFLDRMPPQLGNFISEAVYNNQLYSWEQHPIALDIPSIHFIHTDGKERKTQEESFEVA